jgi:DNA ligase-1
MRAFAALIDRLSLTPARGGKLTLLADYFRAAPDPDRGYALAALCGTLDFPSAKPAQLRALAISRVDPELFALSYDYVGDLAETIALIWPAAARANRPPALGEIVEALRIAPRLHAQALIAGWLDALDATGRWALLKLVTGGFRIGAGARLARQALANLSGKPVAEIEEIWHALAAPYEDLFAWLEERGPRPQTALYAAFRPVMLAHALDEGVRARGWRRAILRPSGSGMARAFRLRARAACASSSRASARTSRPPFPTCVRICILMA